MAELPEGAGQELARGGVAGRGEDDVAEGLRGPAEVAPAERGAGLVDDRVRADAQFDVLLALLDGRVLPQVGGVADPVPPTEKSTPT